MALNNKLIKSLDHLSNKNNEIEKKIGKLATQTYKIERKFTQIANIPYSNLFKNYAKKLDNKNDPNSFFEKQLELTISKHPQKFLTENIKTDPLTWEIILKALNFPKDKNDVLGFSALKRAREHNAISELLRVSEDFLNLIAKDAIYLDDLIIEPPPVEAWLNFIRGDQNNNKRSLTCIGIDAQIQKLKSRIKSDAIFRDTSLMLMRRFDLLLRDRLETASDDEIFKIAETRSGKAFLIVGKLSDSF